MNESEDSLPPDVEVVAKTAVDLMLPSKSKVIFKDLFRLFTIDSSASVCDHSPSEFYTRQGAIFFRIR